MDLQQAKKIANNLLTKYELTNNGWVFKFDNTKRRLGRCNYTSKIISVSKYITELNTEYVFQNILLHEIAHALVDPIHGHDDVWKQKAKDIGCKYINRCAGKDIIRPVGKYVAICQTCATKLYRHRPPQPYMLYSCNFCDPQFNENFLITYKNNF